MLQSFLLSCLQAGIGNIGNIGGGLGGLGPGLGALGPQAAFGGVRYSVVFLSTLLDSPLDDVLRVECDISF